MEAASTCRLKWFMIPILTEIPPASKRKGDVDGTSKQSVPDGLIRVILEEDIAMWTKVTERQSKCRNVEVEKRLTG